MAKVKKLTTYFKLLNKYHSKFCTNHKMYLRWNDYNNYLAKLDGMRRFAIWEQYFKLIISGHIISGHTTNFGILTNGFDTFLEKLVNVYDSFRDLILIPLYLCGNYSTFYLIHLCLGYQRLNQNINMLQLNKLNLSHMSWNLYLQI